MYRCDVLTGFTGLGSIENSFDAMIHRFLFLVNRSGAPLYNQLLQFDCHIIIKYEFSVGIAILIPEKVPSGNPCSVMPRFYIDPYTSASEGAIFENTLS